jgi:eukaryotic-like serine/threonine-protein kinase
VPLTIGTKIGPYQIHSPLGEGGMGVVFRARDTKLGRDVAIKVLSDAFANDPDRLARFEREAQVLASLNHANIAHIYGLEETQETRCIVMELVEGETLAQVLKRGPLPVDEALRISKQILEALEAAHEKGIVHRDLKPGNVMVLPDGNVKVLDFGLAKAVDGAPSGANVSHSPTLSMAATQAGIILGTAAYMSPEQAKGLSADTRSDVFSFGCVLYEMLTGSQAFQGETSAEVLASVLVRDPDFKLLPPDLTPRFYDLLRRCLEKNPKRRWHAVADLRIELENIAVEIHKKPETAQPVAPVRRSREKLAWTIAALTTLLAVTVPVFLYVRLPKPRADSSTMRFEIDAPELAGTAIVVSPDGKRLVSAAARNALWVRSLEYLNPQILQGTEGSASPFWSPDGRFIAFFSGGKLKKVDLLGAPPQTLCDAASVGGGTWNRDGVILFSDGNGPIKRVAAGGGSVQPVTELDKSRDETAHLRPFFLPDGKHFLFLAHSNKPENSAIFAGLLDSNERKLLVASNGMAVFAPPHYLLFLRQNTLMTQEFDPDRLELQGDPFPVAEQVGVGGTPGLSSFSVSENGVLAYRNVGSGGVVSGAATQFSIVDRIGKVIESFGDPAGYQNPVLSPDQQFIAFNRTEPNNDIWVQDMVRRTTSRFTFDPGIDDFPLWSPDGANIVFSSNRDGGVFNLYQKQSGGTGQEQLLLKTSQQKAANDWSRDGRYIIYNDLDPKTGADLWILPTFGDKKPYEYLRTPFFESQARFSPDGRWVAYTSNESGRPEVYVQSFPQTDSKWQISTDGGFQPQWRADGKELFYSSLAVNEQFMVVDILTKPSDSVFKADIPRKLFVFNVIAGAVSGGGQTVQRNSYQVMKDGQRFLMNGTPPATEGRTIITVVLNWTAGLKK